MSINKNTLWTIFTYSLIISSPNAFMYLPLSSKGLIMMTAIAYILGAIILYLINRHTNQQNTLSEKKSKISQVILYGLLGILISVFLQSIMVTIESTIFNQSVDSANTERIIEIIKTVPLFIIAVSVGGPIMEEFVFRYSLINFMNQKLNIWVSAIISSFLFAAIHRDGHYLLYGSLGFFFFLLYKKTGSIYTSIITHAGMNLMVVIAQIMLVK